MLEQLPRNKENTKKKSWATGPTTAKHKIKCKQITGKHEWHLHKFTVLVNKQVRQKYKSKQHQIINKNRKVRTTAILSSFVNAYKPHLQAGILEKVSNALSSKKLHGVRCVSLLVIQKS